MGRAREHGGGRLEALSVLLVVLATFYSGLKIVPYYVDNYQLLEEMTREARFSGVQRKSPQEVRDDIFNQARQLSWGFPLSLATDGLRFPRATA